MSTPFDYRLWTAAAGTLQSGSSGISSVQRLYTSESHPRNFSANGPDNGGPFLQIGQKYSESSGTPDDMHLFGSFSSNYTGGFKAVRLSADGNSGIWPDFWSEEYWDNTQLLAAGTTAIARLAPTNPVVDLATLLGELKQGLPRLGIETFKPRSSKARSAGSDYLNYEFGWKPLSSDLRKFADAVKNQEKLLAQYERNSGKAVRRKTSLYETIEKVITTTDGVLPAPLPLWHWIDREVIGGRMVKTITTKRRAWFSGAFTYYLKTARSPGSSGWLQKANKLFGIRLTPEVVWNLTPWSWALDWVGNTGDVLHNVSAFANDGLVMPYAYVMEEISIEHKYELSNVQILSRRNPAHAGFYNFDQIFTSTMKKRLPATPFGFGLNPDLDFSSRQKAIIAALGLTKFSRK